MAALCPIALLLTCFIRRSLTIIQGVWMAFPELFSQGSKRFMGQGFTFDDDDKNGVALTQ